MFAPRADRLTRLAGLGLLAGALLHGSPLASQSAQETRQVVSKSVSVGSDAAALRLEFETGPEFEVRLEEGRIVVGGETVDDYVPGGATWEAWRGLLGFAVALDDGPLARTLVDWTPPEGLDGEELDAARLLDRTLEEALAAPTPAPDAPDVPTVAPEAPGAVGGDSGVGIGSLTALLGRRDRLPGLAEALEGLDIEELSLTVGEDRSFGPESRVDATVVVVDGDLDLEGTVAGDVVVVGGDLRLGPDAVVEGEVRLADGELIRQGGEVRDGIRVIDVSPKESTDVDDLRDQLRDEIRSEIRAATRGERDRSTRGPLRNVFDAVGGLIANIVSIIVLGIVGAIALHFAGPNLDAVAETTRRTPGRALAVGTAGAFLLLPLWILGMLVLAVSIIGIPALILWIPLFPAAAVLAGGLGYLAAARNVGVWLTRQDYPYTGWVRITNPVTLIMGGALVLSAGFIGANLVDVLPFTGALGVLLAVSSTLLTAAAVLMGFGSVILTRAGRRPEFSDEDLFGGMGRWGGGSGPAGGTTSGPADADPWTGAPDTGTATADEAHEEAEDDDDVEKNHDAPTTP